MQQTKTIAGVERPDTYFLQTAILRGFAAIEARLDPDQELRPFFLIRLKPIPRLEHQIWDLGDMCARYVDAFILGRQVTGCTDYEDAELALRTRLHNQCDPFANPFMAGRMLLAFVDEHLQQPSPETRQRLVRLTADIRGRLTFEKDYAFWFKPPDGWSSMRNPTFGDFAPYPTYPLGGVVLALARLAEAAPFPEGEDLLRRLSKFILEISGTFDAEGRFQGHTHSGGILTAAAGLMRWAILQGDSATVARMKNAFDWSRRYSHSWGWVPDGLGKIPGTSETCSIVDALHLGLLIARHVDGAYYEIAERYARNQLLENQIVRPELAVPEDGFPAKAAILKALHGSWASRSQPNSLDASLDMVEGCCLGAGIRGCYLAWEHAVTSETGEVTVNMWLSRNSPWVEVISHQPNKGKLEILIHRAPVLRIRLPSWVEERSLSVAVNCQRLPAAPVRKRCVTLRDLNPGDAVSLDFPLCSALNTEDNSGAAYQAEWKGNTVAAIRPKGRDYPLFEREWIKQAAAPYCKSGYLGQTGGPVHW